ncbi:MAG: Asp-tRNA(Asn)/Glu-tRNA(Gln) amidotransferase subunit GatA [candidate division Zixibacteria bacterium]|nr:Asp-tRNA(Asn)/Glu-tRNA(Gln) amidotransferase subunit GatA [candidate division Zixibacteria bacterium]
MADHPTTGDIPTLRAQRESGAQTARAVVDRYLERLQARRDLNSYVLVAEDDARTAAEDVDAGNRPGPLAGVPLAIKDNILVEGQPCTCGSRMLDGWVAPYDATAVARLRAAGAVFLGKTNCDEFGMGSSNENSYFGPAKNPIDPSRVTGGSSGGSAAAVADGQAMAAIGSDTGGSIRLPASYCGVIGLKPTYGAVSRWGLVAFASSLDQIGVLARTVDDARSVFHVIRGHDPRDATSRTDPPIHEETRPRRIGLLREYLEEGLDPDIRAAVLKVADALKEQGHDIVDASLPSARYALQTYYIICCAEASSNLARYDGVKYGYRTGNAAELIDMFEQTRDQGFGDEVKRRILLGSYVLSAGYFDQYYGTAQRMRQAIISDYTRAFVEVDCLLTPTAPNCAFPIGEKLDDPLTMYLVDVYTTSVNLAGLPGLSFPCGAIGGLPIGAQLIGRPMEEDLLLDLAGQVYESVRPTITLASE